MAENTALQTLIEQLRDRQSISTLIGAAVIEIVIREATELLPKERQDIQEAFDKGKGNVFGKTCFLIKDGTEYFDKTFTQNK